MQATLDPFRPHHSGLQVEEYIGVIVQLLPANLNIFLSFQQQPSPVQYLAPAITGTDRWHHL